ncbi:uncharacterized protein LOC103483802 isoform X2 [Cucumis melo]|uniref:Uncharacterized protein LOC103483802 isoform X2 n=1 Tax=Cucumis melo TaxID=3656 RepID=A0A1S3AWY3_CUCME|nr:uncharacterized protein LOC103483802 isoform X2 [Cucumis melo]XP_050942107.1 uncharacterized protein LOC103483802 isoform X2 [Cucumis melo]
MGVTCREANPQNPHQIESLGLGFHLLRFGSREFHWNLHSNRHFFFTIFVEMQVVSSSRRLSILLKSSSTFLQFDRFLVSNFPVNQDPPASHQWRTVSGIARQCCSPMAPDCSIPMYLSIPNASFSSVAHAAEEISTVTAKELYDKMLESVEVKRSMPPNAWMWSLIQNCKTDEDIQLLFGILERLRKFRLSNLRIHDNYNSHLCQEVAKACVRAGAIQFGKKTLWIHNVNGLTPSVASAHHLLAYAEEHNDLKLMAEVVTLLRRNKLPLQPGTADIVFRICYNADNWELLSKYFKKFSEAGVKFRRTSFDTLMRFASKRGDVDCLWKFDRMRAETTKQHTLGSAFSSAKGLLLERKPKEAAAMIHEIYQAFQNFKSDFTTEIQKMVNEWPSQVSEHKKEEHRKEFDADLKSYISTMLSNLQNVGVEVNANI